MLRWRDKLKRRWNNFGNLQPPPILPPCAAGRTSWTFDPGKREIMFPLHTVCEILAQCTSHSQGASGTQNARILCNDHHLHHPPTMTRRRMRRAMAWSNLSSCSNDIRPPVRTQEARHRWRRIILVTLLLILAVTAFYKGGSCRYDNAKKGLYE